VQSDLEQFSETTSTEAFALQNHIHRIKRNQERG
jgi:hypothetical protein